MLLRFQGMEIIVELATPLVLVLTFHAILTHFGYWRNVVKTVAVSQQALEESAKETFWLFLCNVFKPYFREKSTLQNTKKLLYTALRNTKHETK